MLPTDSPEWGTIREAAERLAVTERTIRNLIARGQVPAIRYSARLIRVDLSRLTENARPLALSGDAA